MGNVSSTIGGKGNFRGDGHGQSEERIHGGICASPEPEPSVPLTPFPFANVHLLLSPSFFIFGHASDDDDMSNRGVSEGTRQIFVDLCLELNLLRRTAVACPKKRAIHNERRLISTFMMQRMSIESMHAHNQRPIPVMIAWSHGGRQVSITGSWDNWARIEPMHRSGKEFVLMKLLPSGLYHYHFVVDGNLMGDRDAPFSSDDPGGTAYNILDVKEFAAKSCENLPDDALPDSPDESYRRNSIHDMDFSKPPPDLPPQMYKPLLGESPSSWTDVHQHQVRPQHVALNHIYTKSCDSKAVALGTTCRFLEKYVTVILYKPSVGQR